MTALPKNKFLLHRDDLSHETVSGNKLHKLKPSLERAKCQGYRTLLSFGGAYSNHLHAMAFACQQIGLNCIGMIRGELLPELTPTLKDCQAWGMQLQAISRKDYRACQGLLQTCEPEACLSAISDLLPLSTQEMLGEQPCALVIPEGGSNTEAVQSLADAYSDLFTRHEFAGVTHAVCATGTGATLAGLRLAAPNRVKVLGIQAVAEGDATIERIKSWIGTEANNLDILPGHLGGFAKTDPGLMNFINTFEADRGILLEPIYTGKMLYKLTELAKQDYFKSSDRVLAIHTGGLQGRRGFSELR